MLNGYCFVSQLFCLQSRSLLIVWEKQRKMATVLLQPCHPWGRPRWNSSLLTWTWPSPSCYGHLESEPQDRTLFLSVFPSLCVTPSYKSLENERKFKTFLKNQNAQVPTHVKWFMFSFNCIWLSASSPFLWPWRSKHLPHAWGCSGSVYLAALSPWAFS